ncbi:MAG: 2-oxo acid dehydrogenase subunit E2, partial [Bacteroidales bacterium]|nr:2-oxo acid dehydrogenase subunit E2 [Bacteroidales bacterium]
MATFDILMPKLGESVQEATITKWFKKVGDTVEEEDVLLEIATDKVDSEIPSPVEGTLIKVLFDEDALVPVGEVIAVIDMDGGEVPVESEEKATPSETAKEEVQKSEPQSSSVDYSSSDKFFSPLVKNIAQKENISPNELNSIAGTGHNGRVRKDDVLNYLENRGSAPASAPTPTQTRTDAPKIQAPAVTLDGGDQVVKMDRMRKMIADHMVMSKSVSPHVTNFIEADVTNLVFWRKKVKDEFQKRENTKLTYMPVFIEATARALKEYPGINAS